GDCPTCSCSGRTTPSSAPISSRGWVYAVGRLIPQFPDYGVEREFAQLGADAQALSGGIEGDRLRVILKDPNNAYLARQLCWVFFVGDVEAFTLICRDDADARRFVEALPSSELAERTVQTIIGVVASPPPGSPCGTSGLPAVWIDHHLTFNLDEFLDAIAIDTPRDSKATKEAKSGDIFRTAARDIFLRLTRRSDNRGVTDEHRALNYLALRYPQLYRHIANAYAEEKLLTGIDSRRWPSTNRALVAIRIHLRGRRTDLIERYQCVVDVTDRFPFLASPLTQIYD
ncbi:MAG: hypothetical protein ABL949_16510, partial [Fimbriimonadaceae bacterium]